MASVEVKINAKGERGMLLGSLELNRIYQMDCLEGMKLIPDKSIDMILCDLPYGTTSCKWDTVIPFEPLWEQYERIIKDNGAIVLTASQPFTSYLIMSKIELFKYVWIWEKTKVGGIFNAKNRPLKIHEDICVFSKAPAANVKGLKMVYNPQGLKDAKIKRKNTKRSGDDTIGNRPSRTGEYQQNTSNYPKDIIRFPSEHKTVHPTQKPVALFEYLIRTYTNEGEIVLDNCMGSGTTAVAALRTGRNFIGFEIEPEYVRIANQRLENVRDEVAEQRLAEGTDTE
jgi:site-specific DNA-methyltransferase (adenine-specific)